MKILHIITRLDRGGSTEDLLNNCIYLHNKKYINKIVCGKTTNPSFLVDEVKSTGIEFINIFYLTRNINLFKDFLSFLKILKIIIYQKPDIVHTRTSKAGILGRWAAWFYKILYNKKIKIIHSTHGHVFYGYYNFLISFLFVVTEKITSYITDRIVVLTKNEIIEHLKYGIGNKNKFYIIHSGIDYEQKILQHNLREKLNISKDVLIIGSAGRLEPVKGYIYFIEAIKKIENKYKNLNTKYLIVGDGSQKQKLLEKVKKYKLTDKVIFAGWKDNMEDYISIMDIYVQPSINEGMCKTIVQAQYLSKPVISTNVQGIPSVMINNKTGILVKPKNPVDLAQSIIKLIQDEKLRNEMGRNAKEWVGKIIDDSGFSQFSLERMYFLIDKLYKIYYN